MKKLIAIGIAILIIGAAGQACAANLITNGGFESPDVGGSFVTYTTAPSGFGWTIVNNAGTGQYGAYGVDLINNYWRGASGASGDQSADIDFGTIIYQSFATVAGQRYSLSFAYANNPDRASSSGSFGVFDTSVFTGEGDYEYEDEDFILNGELTHNTSTHSNMNFSRYNGTFIAASSSTTFGFAGEAGNQYWGFVVDDVNITAVPEPMSLSLLGLGLLGAMGAGIRSRKK